MPLALMDITRKKITNAVKAGSGANLTAPSNQLVLSTSFPNAKFRDVVRPNADTYYRTGFLDVGAEPVVLTVPNTNDRYYLLPMLDAFGNVFASPGKRTAGTQADTFLITGPKWTGNIPSGMKQIKSPGQGIFIDNAINRYAIGNRNPLKYNADSSVDLYFQHMLPGKLKDSNWLPAPAGPFNLMLQMYWPAEEFLSGNWTPPAVTKLN
jgi:hypothetical protein